MPENDNKPPSGHDEPRTLARREAGVCAHVSSLPGAYGIGEIGAEAFAFLDRMAHMGLRVWQVLPLGPTGYGDSPYQPLSTFAGNPLLIDVASLCREGLLEQAEIDSLKDLPAHEVDFGRLIPLKTALLRLAVQRFETRADAQRKAARDRFIAEHSAEWLEDYACFQILKDRHGGRAWTEWEDRYKHRDPPAMREFASRERLAMLEIATTQFFFNEQWQRLRAHARSLDIRLFGDLPIYLALDSADAWAHPEILRVGPDGQPSEVSGVPPDYFSADGQLWGNPLYDWPYHAKTGFAWWAARLRHAMSLLDFVRIDHFRAFESYWAIPAGAKTAREGTWEKGPGDAIFDALRATLGELPIVAEDLGDFTEAVDELRDRQRIPGMKVLQFMVGEEEFNPDEIRRNCVCYTGTHDNDTTRGWFNGGPGDTRSAEEIRTMQNRVLERSKGSADTVHLDLIRMAFQSPARLAIAPLQDFLGLGSEARLNTPGSQGGHWRWRMKPARLGDELVARIHKAVQAAGR